MVSTNPISLKSLHHVDFLFISLTKQFKRGFLPLGLFPNGWLWGKRVDVGPKHEELTWYIGQSSHGHSGGQALAPSGHHS